MESDLPDEIEQHRLVKHRRGLIIGIIGLAGFFPSLLVAVFMVQYRFTAALSALVFWIVWKIGKTMMKVNSPEG